MACQARSEREGGHFGIGTGTGILGSFAFASIPSCFSPVWMYCERSVLCASLSPLVFLRYSVQFASVVRLFIQSSLTVLWKFLTVQLQLHSLPHLEPTFQISLSLFYPDRGKSWFCTAAATCLYHPTLTWVRQLHTQLPLPIPNWVDAYTRSLQQSKSSLVCALVRLPSTFYKHTDRQSQGHLLLHSKHALAVEATTAS